MPPISGNMAEVTRLVPHELIQERVAEQMVNIPVPPGWDNVLPQQREPKRIVRKGVPVAQINAKIVEAIQFVLLGRIPERIAEQITLLYL